jgi:hypothetical protein
VHSRCSSRSASFDRWRGADLLASGLLFPASGSISDRGLCWLVGVRYDVAESIDDARRRVVRHVWWTHCVVWDDGHYNSLLRGEYRCEATVRRGSDVALV